MKTLMNKIMIVAIAIVAFAFIPPANPELEIGKPIPNANMKMMDISGKEVSLAEAKGENGLLVIFSCNTCFKFCKSSI